MDLLGAGLPTANSRPNGRKGSRKVRTGCLTCKVRKVKCDETKPQCLRCTRTGHNCRGYAVATAPVKSQDPPPPESQPDTHHHNLNPSSSQHLAVAKVANQKPLYPSPSPSPGPCPLPTIDRSDQSVSFDFFRKYSAALFSRDSDASFWGDLVLRVGAHEPAIYNAASAIGSFHLDFLHASHPGHAGALELAHTRPSDTRLRGISQYNKAIQNVVPILSGSKRCEPVILIMISILFACIEYLQGNERQGLKHIIQARRLLAHFSDTNQLSSSDISIIKRHAVPLITRSSWRAQFFGVEASAIPEELQNYRVVPTSFASVQDARDCFFAIFDQTLYSIRPDDTPVPPGSDSGGPPHGPDVDLRQLARKRVNTWQDAFVLSVAIGPPEFRDSLQAVSIQLWSKSSNMCYELWGEARDCSEAAAISGKPNYPESLFDSKLESFKELLYLSTRFFAIRNETRPAAPEGNLNSHIPEAPDRPDLFNKDFQFESHILSNILWGAGKCRHPRVRREFARLLAQNGHVYENAIHAKEAAAVAARVIKLEEDAALRYAKKHGAFTLDSATWGSKENPDLAAPQPDSETRQFQLDRDFAAVCSLGYWPLPLNGSPESSPEPAHDSPPAASESDASPTLAYRPAPGSKEVTGQDPGTWQGTPPSHPRAHHSKSEPVADKHSTSATLRQIPHLPSDPPFGIPYSVRISETHLISRHPNGVWIQLTRRPWGSSGKAEYIQEWVEL